MLRHLDAVMVEFSGYRPYQGSTVIATVAAQELYSLPTACLWVDRVWVERDYPLDYMYPLDYNFLPDDFYAYDLSRRREQLRARFASYGQPVAVPWNNQLQLYPTPNQDGTINVEYSGVHEQDAGGNYTTVAFQDIQHVETLLVARCLEILANDAPKRASYTEGQTRMDPGSMAADFRKRAFDERSKVTSALSECLVGIG
jgi:hypothetical protein